ncbi:MAG: C4-type zinc ribbon domain-containing protein [Planctomycetota bacterium]
MREVLRVLVDLQELDEDLYRIRRELERLPEERDRKRGEIDAKIQRVKELDNEILQVKMQEKEFDDAARASRQRIMKLESEASKCTDQALLAAYAHEVRTLRREISDTEDESLRLIERREAKDRDKSALGEQIEAEEADFAVYLANVEKEIAEAKEKEAGLVAKREERIGTSVPRDVRDTYEKLLEARDGMALAALEERTCQGCYIQVPTNIYVRLARGRDLVQCPNCQRILFMWD